MAKVVIHIFYHGEDIDPKTRGILQTFVRSVKLAGLTVRCFERYVILPFLRRSFKQCHCYVSKFKVAVLSVKGVGRVRNVALERLRLAFTANGKLQIRVYDFLKINKHTRIVQNNSHAYG